ncbi:uroporphyrinogen III methyltransferase [Leucobacter sp. Psy1]|uniref:uroporphyrinogen-III synthase n=1 Tax=Leucobacter sp. Psy1 TaxID=2875729 RepID=UPI001CD21AF1|nr:uroporphyrinogen-III synthase [Leucobacter sp. Psy1]UBH06961.1 uroporphyrinogen III methyltransferase [Leucobacter sp. Psy1]
MTARILIARGGDAGERLAAAVRARGGEPVVAPLIVQAPPEDPGELATAMSLWNAGLYDWMVVTSAHGATAVADAGAGIGGAIAAVGPATAEALTARGLDVALTPDGDFSADGIAEALLDLLGEEPTRILLPVSEIAGTTFERALREAGHRVDRVTAYRTLPAPETRETVEAAALVASGACDAILVTSGSIAREVARRFAPLPDTTRVVSIGHPTARALREAGVRVDAIADPHTADGLLDALERLDLLSAAEHPDLTPAPESRTSP